MQQWAVTGPVGAGKSRLAALLVQKGAILVDGDKIGHEILKFSEVQQEIADTFGAEYIKNGIVDRHLLGNLVFENPDQMALLNRITHRRISQLAVKKMDQLAQSGEHRLAVLEAAVYFLFPEAPPVDLVISVVAADDLRIQRMVENRNLSVAQARARLETQAFMDKFWGMADIVIINDGTEADLAEAADGLWSVHM